MNQSSTDPHRKSRKSDIILQRINELIASGTYSSGDKLPPERELAERLGASRPSVRSALAKLELQGIVSRVQGDGTYVSSQIEDSLTDPLVEIFKHDESFKYDALEYRFALEEACCALAAENANSDDKKNIQKHYDDWLEIHNKAESPENEAKADFAFHIAIAEATHNFIFPHAMRSSLSMMQKSVEVNIHYLNEAPHRRHSITKQHTEILNAILENDVQAARQAIKDHLNFIRSVFHKSDRETQRQRRTDRTKTL